MFVLLNCIWVLFFKNGGGIRVVVVVVVILGYCECENLFVLLLLISKVDFKEFEGLIELFFLVWLVVKLIYCCIF